MLLFDINSVAAAAVVGAATVSAVPTGAGSDASACIFGSCLNGKRLGLFGTQCFCEPSFQGVCCEEEIPCADLTIDTFQNLDLEEWTRASWFGQYQQTTPFEPENSLFCVAATFDIIAEGVEGPAGSTFTTTNTGYFDSVDGELNAAVACLGETDVSGKINFAPCQFYEQFTAPFWINDIGVAHDGTYEWAIVTGGPMTERLADGKCGREGGVFSLLTRNKKATHHQILEMAASLRRQGLSTSLLKHIEQDGCGDYEGMRIKTGSLKDGPGPVPVLTGVPAGPPAGPPAGSPTGGLPPCFLNLGGPCDDSIVPGGAPPAGPPAGTF